MSPLSARIKRLRRDAGLSQTDLARRLHLTAQSVQQWESGATAPRGANLTRLAKALGVPPAALLFGGTEQAGAGVRQIPVLDPEQVPADAAKVAVIDRAPEDASWIFPPEPVGPLAFALRVSDPYLEPVVCPGDLAVVDPDREPEHLSFVALRVSGRAMALQYHRIARRAWGASIGGVDPPLKLPAPKAAILGVIAAKVRLLT